MNQYALPTTRAAYPPHPRLSEGVSPPVSREYTPEEIREVGQNACPPIADSYDGLASSAKSAANFGGSFFGTHENNELWSELADLCKRIIDETPACILGMGQALVEAADRYDADEQHTARELDSLFTNLETDYYDNHETVVDERTAAEQERRDQLTASQAELSPAEPI